MSEQTQGRPDRLKQAVFNLLLGSYPVPWSRDEIIRELAANPNEFDERDAVNNSLRDLVAHGLLHQTGDLFLPTRPAIHAAHLCE